MIDITASMERILKQPSRVVSCKAQIGDTDLDASDIVNFSVKQELCSDVYTIGNAASAILNITLIKSENLPTDWQSSPIQVWVGVGEQEGVTNPELITSYKWFSMGKFYLDDKSITNTNLTVSIAGYDILKKLENSIYETELTYPATAEDVLGELEDNYGLTFANVDGVGELSVDYKLSGNIRQVLKTLALYFGGNFIVDGEGNIKLVQFDGEEIFEITGANYEKIELLGEGEQTLSRFTLELPQGDLTAGTDEGKTLKASDSWFTTQTQVNSIYTNSNMPLTYQAYKMPLQGMPQLELGDTIEVTTPSEDTYNLIILQREFTFNGGMKDSFSASPYPEEGARVAASNNSIVQSVRNAEVKVNKLDNDVSIIAEEVEGYSGQIAALVVGQSEISASVTAMGTAVNQMGSTVSNMGTTVSQMGTTVETVRQEVSGKISAEAATLIVEQELANGVDKVVTATGYRFDANGLTIDKEGDQFKTIIDNNGLQVIKSGQVDAIMLEVNQAGVDANILSSNSLVMCGLARFMKMGTNRIGCYWIGG